MSSPRTFLCAMILQTSGKRAYSLFPECSYIICNDNARRVHRQSGKTEFLQLWHCRAEAYLMQWYCKRAERELALYLPSAAISYAKYCKASATVRRENTVLPDLMLPSRSISYAKIRQFAQSAKHFHTHYTYGHAIVTHSYIPKSRAGCARRQTATCRMNKYSQPSRQCIFMQCQLRENVAETERCADGCK